MPNITIPKDIPKNIITRFLILLFWPWCSSKINNVVICSNIPVEIAKNLNNHSLKNSYCSNVSPKIAPTGAVSANRIIYVYLINLFRDILFKKNINTAAIGSLWIKMELK